MIGRITRVLSNDYTVRYDDGNEKILLRKKYKN